MSSGNMIFGQIWMNKWCCLISGVTRMLPVGDAQLIKLFPLEVVIRDSS